MSTRFLSHFFEPGSIVVVGASEKPHSMGGLVLRNLREGGFSGAIWALNPKGYEQVFGEPCVSRVSRLPEVPDLAVICSPVETVPAMIERLGRFGIRAALVLSGGAHLDDPCGETESVRSRMLSAARASGIRVLGPECMGLIVPGRKLNASYASQPVKRGRVAYLGQSGMLGNAMIDWAAGRGIGFSHLLTLGDSVDVMLPDLIDYINQYAPTQAILLHLERILDAQHLMTAMRDASRHRLVLAIKSGRTAESDISNLPPTPGIANRDQVFDAAFARAGVVRVDDSDELFDALETLSRMKPLRGDRLAVVSNGLGPAMLAIDKLISAGGRLATFEEATQRRLRQEHRDRSKPGENPVDLGGLATPEHFVETLELVAADPGVDAVLVVHAPTRLAPSLDTARAVIEARKRFKRNLLTSWMGLEEALSARHECNQAGIPTYISPEKAIKAFMHMVDYQRVQSLLQETPPSLSFDTTPAIRAHCRELIDSARSEGRQSLDHSEVSRVLETYGIPPAPSRYLQTPEQADEATQGFDGPMALKVVHDGNCRPFRYRRHPHKLSAGLLQDLATSEQVAEGVIRLGDKVREKFPDLAIREYCLQAMQRGKHSMQLCAGITRDPVFGPLIVFGIGGYKVNILADRQVALPPLNMSLAADVVGRTHAARLIREHSSDPERDIERICELLVKLSQMASDLPTLSGLELNPVLLNRDGLVAVDFAMDLGEPARFAIMPYPEELREWVTLGNGWDVEVRPIRAEDAPLITRFHTQLSEQSIRFRYFHHKADLSQRDLSMLSHINYDRQMAFIAEHLLDDGAKEMLGVVRVWNDPDNIRTEFSIIIRDDLQGLGIGKLLMERMIRYSKGVGTLEMVGQIMADNHPMRALMKQLGFRQRYNMEEQVVDAVLRLNEPQSEWQRHRLETALPD
ncbi:bifunctional acetate--CoA ligase family protein/GNAT family N-acetyltransferase [Halomonas elongata]|uniref:Bifunctional acetate--CoA ligase family protein/GNAT family N-acetyltransferase n=3 Tax=Halomonas elongata TaxID=2746 RepID=E1V321_HALED|nr:bifunctional acetate--CoA ligase family protein/GNAT family N-acetyltransferase [Halomonas elongata]MBW5800704.1 bifunctional acetate--CoA ligase family protein/GNAT family N-acetyltransferase [Halomonas elongata]WBF19777.1 bifunctional acetate--CoA ligase family protein/GNAT family N-acetyltransferase [Halomonas elongata]WPU48646.1 bifunctional acetate--CoA ligase family protein/GNAT family N-acetyltransferase [Halomonas elongata DSM 2581]WVI73210.1 bifunctional acetate--CoA ligase family p